MTMSWSDDVSESTRSQTHTLPYVPPNFRAAPGPISGHSEFPIRQIGDLSRRFGALEVSPAIGINFEAYEDIPVKVSGAEVPEPASSFAEMEMAMGERLSENVRRCGYVKPTPVQRHAIPIAAVGRDLMACAQTGSGKTAAFCFPIISGITKNITARSRIRSPSDCCYPTALILSPTRELASQIHDEAKKFAQNTGVKIVAAYGGAPVFPQLRNLERGVDILVATPGRLIDLYDRGRISLSSVKYLTLDEADRMLDMGFEVQIRRIVQNTDMPPPGARQTMLFSATFPAEIQKMASDFLSNYIFLAVGRVGSSTNLIAQRVEYVEESEKRNYLMHMLHDQIVNGACGKLALTLVFVETKKGADALEYCLWENGFPAISIHGDKVQMERERALRSFKSGETPILVATAVASRGLDIPHVAHVVNFDLPRDIDDYVHRIGRTGRAGKSGLATAFFNDKNALIAKPLTDLMKESNQEVPQWLYHYFAGDKPAGAQNHRAGKFGGYDYRNLSSSTGGENFNYPSFDPSIAPAPKGGEFSSSSSLSANAEPYLYASDKYGSAEGYKSVVATGWD